MKKSGLSRVVIRVMGGCGRKDSQPATRTGGCKPAVSPIGYNNSNYSMILIWYSIRYAVSHALHASLNMHALLYVLYTGTCTRYINTPAHRVKHARRADRPVGAVRYTGTAVPRARSKPLCAVASGGGGGQRD